MKQNILVIIKLVAFLLTAMALGILVVSSKPFTGWHTTSIMWNIIAALLWLYLAIKESSWFDKI